MTLISNIKMLIRRKPLPDVAKILFQLVYFKVRSIILKDPFSDVMQILHYQESGDIFRTCCFGNRVKFGFNVEGRITEKFFLRCLTATKESLLFFVIAQYYSQQGTLLQWKRFTIPIKSVFPMGMEGMWVSEVEKSIPNALGLFKIEVSLPKVANAYAMDITVEPSNRETYFSMPSACALLNGGLFRPAHAYVKITEENTFRWNYLYGISDSISKSAYLRTKNVVGDTPVITKYSIIDLAEGKAISFKNNITDSEGINMHCIQNAKVYHLSDFVEHYLCETGRRILVKNETFLLNKSSLVYFDINNVKILVNNSIMSDAGGDVFQRKIAEEFLENY